MELFSLKEKTWIVTGCSSGLGEAMATALAEAGANIIGFNRSPSKTLPNAISKMRLSYREYLLDITDFSMIDRTIAALKNGNINIHGLVNNAGIILRNDAMETSIQDWQKVIDVNLTSVFYLSQQVAKTFFSLGGKIINVASMLSYQGGVRVPAYTASKSAIKGLTMALANEWASKGIHVNAIAPGYFETANTKPLRDDLQRLKAISERIPQGRWGQPHDLAGAVIFLASAASDYVNGITLPVDGGWLGR
jgi:2-dehydro-3-deoxy-D-gluconate 5-dehydrogenase